MNHQRHVIREAIVALLAAAGTAAGTRVFDHPYDPRETFPALTVEDDSEAQSAMAIHSAVSGPLERNYRFVVTAEVQQSDNAARQRDQLLADVERLLAAASLAGVKSITPLSYQPSQHDSGQKPIRLGHQMFEAIYVTPQGDPSTAI